MSEVILHHYPQSPVPEKVRVALGIKGLQWRSVEVPRIPPKPQLMPLTGGYRRAPVMQVGADVYCDSQCILRELERRFPQPTLFPGGAQGLAWGVSRWTDGPLFEQAVGVVLGASQRDLPPEFAADRGRLYFGPDYDLEAKARDIPHLLAQLRAQLGWADARIGAGRRFMLGACPGLPDALLYHVVWFLRGRYAGGARFLEEFRHLLEWEQRVQAIGHGEPTPLTAKEALDVARAAEPNTPRREDALDPQRLAPGMHVGVTPEGDGGDPTVYGELLAVCRDEVVVLREEEPVGRVAVHFPRAGYRVTSP